MGRSGSEKSWWVLVPCRSRKYVRTESQKAIEEILQAKLATIEEVPEICEENGIIRAKQLRSMSKKGKNKSYLKVKMCSLFTTQFSLKETYNVLLICGFASKRSLQGGIAQY